jgi:hypothetical protein
MVAVTMRRIPTARRKRYKPAAGAWNDLGPPEIGQHGDWRLLEMPVVGRRIMREPIHERLWRAARVTAAQFQAAEDYAADVAIASGMRDTPSLTLDRVDGRASWDPSMKMVNAISRLRRSRDRIGLPASWLLERACADCVSTAWLARALYGRDNAAARVRADEAIVSALRALVRDPT